jgi:hypothetical protein
MFPFLPEDIEIYILKKYVQMEILPLIKLKYRIKFKIEKKIKFKIEEIINSLIDSNTDIYDEINNKRLDEMSIMLIELHKNNIFKIL